LLQHSGSGHLVRSVCEIDSHPLFFELLGVSQGQVLLVLELSGQAF
jgi:hypothetical protein